MRSNGFYWVLPSFSRALQCFSRFFWVQVGFTSFPAFTGFSQGFTGFYRVFLGLFNVSQGFAGFKLVSLVFLRLLGVLKVFTGFLPSFRNSHGCRPCDWLAAVQPWRRHPCHYFFSLDLLFFFPSPTIPPKNKLNGSFFFFFYLFPPTLHLAGSSFV